MGYNNKWHHTQQTSPGLSPTSVSNLSGFLCPVSVYNAFETTILVILTWRIHMKLVQRLVRGCPDPLGLGVSHSLCVWTESEEGTEGSDRHPYDPAFLCVMGLLCTIGNYRCSPETHTKLLTCCHTLFYAACHVQHDCNIFCLTHIQLCLLLFLTSLSGISLRQTFLPLFRLKSLFTTVLFHIKGCSLTPFALRAPKSLESFWGSWSLWSWGNELGWLYTFLLLKANRPVHTVSFPPPQGFGWAISLPVHCFPCLTVFAVGSHAWPEDMLHSSAQASLSPTCLVYVVWRMSDLCWSYWGAP